MTHLFKETRLLLEHGYPELNSTAPSAVFWKRLPEFTTKVVLMVQPVHVPLEQTLIGGSEHPEPCELNRTLKAGPHGKVPHSGSRGSDAVNIPTPLPPQSCKQALHSRSLAACKLLLLLAESGRRAG